MSTAIRLQCFILTITRTMKLFVLILWFGTPMMITEGANKIEARTRLKSFRTKFDSNRRRSTHESVSLREVLDFENTVDFSPEKIARSSQGNTIVKYRETIQEKKVHVFDGEVTAMFDKNGDGLDISGSFYEDIDSARLFRQQNLSASQAVDIAKNAHGHSIEEIKRLSYKLNIFVGDDSVDYLAFFVDYFVVVDGVPQRPFTIVDSKSGKILMKFNNLESCNYYKKNYGGNVKIGKIHYGTSFSCQNVERDGNQCFLENEFVRVIDMNSTVDDNKTESATFKCNETYPDSVNGAYSPAFDALFYGSTVAKMLHEWYQVTPERRPLLLRVHYSKNLTDAFWDGEYCSFGDSDKYKYFPMVSLDIVAHEIGHCITEQYSNLLYMGESGGISEAFSDMMGETAEYYLGRVDWMVGFSVTRHKLAIRYFEDITRDNNSIVHIRDYYEGMDTHSSSGIFRKVFYSLVKRYHISTRKAFQVFLHANQIYWHKMSTFISAACDVLKSALDLGTWVNRFAKAFREVGIEGCNIEDHIFWLRSDEDYSDIYVSSDTRPIFGFSAPPWAGKVMIETKGGVPVYITLYYASILTEEYYVLTSDVNFLNYTVENRRDANNFFIQLSTDQEELTYGVHISVRYECDSDYKTDDDLIYRNFQKDCLGKSHFERQKYV